MYDPLPFIIVYGPLPFIIVFYNQYIIGGHVVKGHISNCGLNWDCLASILFYPLFQFCYFICMEIYVFNCMTIYGYQRLEFSLCGFDPL